LEATIEAFAVNTALFALEAMSTDDGIVTLDEEPIPVVTVSPWLGAGKVREALDGISLEEAFAQIQARRTAATTPDKSVKQVEVETPAAIEGRNRLGSAGRRVLRAIIAKDGLLPAVDEAD
jgi:hypothetical protein